MKIPKAALCGCMTNVSPADLPELLNHPQVDLLEWRLDSFLQSHSPEELRSAFELLSSRSPRHPVLATNRPRREGGAFDGPEALRLDLLQEAAEAGAEWIDLEADVPDTALDRFRTGKTRLLVSHHEFSGTPDRARLERLIREMAQRETGAVKLATTATVPEDNLRVLELIPFGRNELGIEVVAFCMGPLGRWSRLVSLLLGSPWTYVQLPGQSAAAPGQFSAAEMRSLLARCG